MAGVRTGSADTVLVVVRGNSASGKSSVAAGLRAGFGRGLAIVGQDNLRRTVLREWDRPGASNVGLIGVVARYALDHGFHVVVEGILYAGHYGSMLAELMSDHRGGTYAYYLDVPFEETLRRHATKPQEGEYGEAEMRGWYRAADLLPGGVETVIGAESALTASVERILRETGLGRWAAGER
ncbi:kinase [Streptomyces sp. NPDC088194]|uniref:kinase n=1 Tax=Streptomyces sp. NPDC088194 TaxID=3154931 RepID=UPI00344B325A